MTRLLAVILFLLAGSQGAFAAAPITFGSSVVLLTGPWRFHTGDNPDWKATAFDDRHWESVDLTPRSGAHDSDVGLSNYVPGWAARGHAGYKGFAWYRTTLHVSVTPGQSLALVGPADVDSAYQIFLNGHLIGGDGDFSRAVPVPVSIQPHLFALPAADWTIANGEWTGELAIRVWCRSAPPPDGGGIHVAPLLGLASAAQGQYRVQWMQTFEGYILDATEGIVFLLLAVMAASLIPFERRESFLPWLIGGLVLVAALRLNQAIMFWGQCETISDYLIFRYMFSEPLALAAWTMTWRAALGQGDERWSRIAVLVLTLLCIAGQTPSLSMLSASIPHGIAVVSSYALSAARIGFALLLVYVFGRGIFSSVRDRWLALLGLLISAIGMFAPELGLIGVPGIWFPFGVGVSRTEYAYIALDIVVFALLLRRLWRHAPTATH